MLAYLLPFRLAPLALGMVLAPHLRSVGRRRPRGRLAPVWFAWLIVTIALSQHSHDPATVLGVIGPMLPLAMGLPAIWWLAELAARAASTWPPGCGRWRPSTS